MNTKKEGRVCRVCNEFVENEGLKKESRIRKDGTRPYGNMCLDCDRDRSRARRAKYRFQGVTLTEKECNHCNEVKPASEFNLNRMAKGGLNFQCRKCSNERQSLVVYTLSGERVRKKKRLVEVYGESCAYCAARMSKNTLETDHIVAMTRRGVHVFENLVLACRPCNNKKHNHNLATFATMMGDKFRPNKYIRSIMAMEEEELVLRGLKRPLPTDDAVDNYRLMLAAMAAEQTDDDNLFDLLIDAGDCRQ